MAIFRLARANTVPELIWRWPRQEMEGFLILGEGVCQTLGGTSRCHEKIIIRWRIWHCPRAARRVGAKCVRDVERQCIP